MPLSHALWQLWDSIRLLVDYNAELVKPWNEWEIQFCYFLNNPLRKKNLTSARSWQDLGKTSWGLAKIVPISIFGKILARSWQVLAKILAKILARFHLGKILPRSWQGFWQDLAKIKSLQDLGKILPENFLDKILPRFLPRFLPRKIVTRSWQESCQDKLLARNKYSCQESCQDFCKNLNQEFLARSWL